MSDFLHLSPASKLINAGMDVGLPFNGSAPDLGAFEIPEPTVLAAVSTLGMLTIRRPRVRRNFITG